MTKTLTAQEARGRSRNANSMLEKKLKQERSRKKREIERCFKIELLEVPGYITLCEEKISGATTEGEDEMGWFAIASLYSNWSLDYQNDAICEAVSKVTSHFRRKGYNVDSRENKNVIGERYVYHGTFWNDYEPVYEDVCGVPYIELNVAWSGSNMGRSSSSKNSRLEKIQNDKNI